MGKLLETRLPIAQGDKVDADTFNRLVRILEINLGMFDPDTVKHYTDSDITTLGFATGAIIFNSTREIHQAFDGTEFRDLYAHRTYLTGLGAVVGLGNITVNTP